MGVASLNKVSVESNTTSVVDACKFLNAYYLSSCCDDVLKYFLITSCFIKVAHLLDVVSQYGEGRHFRLNRVSFVLTGWSLQVTSSRRAEPGITKRHLPLIANRSRRKPDIIRIGR